MLLRPPPIQKLLFALLTACPPSAARAAELKAAPAAAAVLTPDTKTLILSAPNEGELLYINTETEKETKKVTLSFKPLALAVQGKSLFASTKGAGTIHALDLETGKVKKQFKIAGEPILNLACHSTKGLLYATNAAGEVFAIDAESGKVTKTKARGQMIVVDQTDGKFVYTGIRASISEQLVIEQGPDAKTKVPLEVAESRAIMLKFAVDGAALKLAAVQDNAALNGKGIALSADGKQIAMAGGGGWASKIKQKKSYGVAVFDTSDMKTMIGEVECGAYPYSVSFHPVLNLGVVVKRGNQLNVFDGKSLAKKASIKAPGGEPAQILYAINGTKIVQFVNSGTQTTISFHPLELGEQDQELLKNALPKK
ncbi:PQQ-binding-like beta-propeller repeat protein [Gemmata sp. G18]|uniref:PQQ-binding-like beta-propeller repeat protein n=1 Tax=Gemmata palustris TaxID=2822762 RepID=A0ABS5C3Q8_9BACT|nr:PQQ-binding-like beta-propeller repeat protein [Gemmata palustris]MBP3959788.1 PQQ-binding-like beta-propeller repeat protein [Gemmata palustris]